MKKENLNLLKYDLQTFADNNENGSQNSNDNNNDNNNDNANVNENNNSQEEKMFTQEQVNRIMSKEKKQGRNSILKELGIDPNNEKALEDLKELIDSQKTNVEKAAEKELANQAILQEAEKRVMLAEAKVEAIKGGIKSQFVDDVITLALAKSEDGDLDIKSILIEFKTKYPMWFEDSNDNNTKAGQNGTGSSVGADSTNNNSKGLGERLAAKRKNQNNVKSSYWNN